VAERVFHSENAFSALVDFIDETVCSFPRHYDLNGNTNLHSGVLLKDSPNARKIEWIIPSIQESHHFANSAQVAFKDILQIVRSCRVVFKENSILVVDKEAHIEKDVRRVLSFSAKPFFQGTSHCAQ